MNAVETSLSSPGGWRRLVRRDVLTRALGPAPRFAVVPGGQHAVNRSGRTAIHATAPAEPTVEMVVLGEDDPRWLQHKIGFKNLRHVHYYLEAARWARLIEDAQLRLPLKEEA